VGAYKFNLDFDKHHLQHCLSRARTIADSRGQQLNSFNIQSSGGESDSSFNIQSSGGESEQLQHSKQLM
jgi:hypothetical protein